MGQVIGVGAGGHAKVVLDILQHLGGSELVGLLDSKPTLWGTAVLGVPVLGDDRLLPELYAQGIHQAFVGVGSVGDTRTRRRLYEDLCRHGFQIVAAIHPRAVIASSVQLGDAPTILAGAIVNAAARLGDNVLVNTAAVVEHDCVIGDHVHIATGACLAGAVSVGNGVHIGMGACIRQGLSIGEGAVVGAGAVVVDEVAPGTVVAGVPARPLVNASVA
ncbi:MAG: acetyltransferase [Candidatus Omnitrophota bacterium]|nr:acetyltransferase [Candidatus Omnitrophota bacterium]